MGSEIFAHEFVDLLNSMWIIHGIVVEGLENACLYESTELITQLADFVRVMGR
jgi:hypothetical protein